MLDLNKRDLEALEPSGSDYVLREGVGSCWVEVDNISVYIIRTPQGVTVELLPKGVEADQSLADCSATFDDADEAIEQREKELQS